MRTFILAILAAAVAQWVPAAPAEACTINLKNCRPTGPGITNRIYACIYNGSDSFHWVNQDETWFNPGESEQLSCSESNCDIDVADDFSCDDQTVNNICAPHLYFYESNGELKSAHSDEALTCKDFCDSAGPCDGPIPTD